MRKLALVFLALVIAAPMEARKTRRMAQRMPAAEPMVLTAEPVADPAAAEHLMSRLREATATKKGRVAAQSILFNSSGRAVLLPAAGSVRGANGTFFRSDVTFANYNDTPQPVAVIWMANGAAAETFTMTVPGDRPPFTINDFVGTTLQRTGLGALFFIPLDAAGLPDIESSALDVFSRIWTPQPNATGTVSQPFPGVDPDLLTGEYEAILLGLR